MSSFRTVRYGAVSFRTVRYGTVAVAGLSMSPTYNPGDWLLVRWVELKGGGARNVPIGVGEVVVFEREEQPGIFYVKRIEKIVSDGTTKYWVTSDNPAGIDSRTWGLIPMSGIRGKVMLRVYKLSERRERKFTKKRNKQA